MVAAKAAIVRTGLKPVQRSKTTKQQLPAVLCLGGMDPSGGAGLQADIQSITSLGCHPLPIVTCLTAQSTCELKQWQSVAPDFLAAQLDCVLTDFTPQAIKLGMLGATEIIISFLSSLSKFNVLLQVPIVCDPVLGASAGGRLSQTDVPNMLVKALLPKVRLLTPNRTELQTLAQQLGEHSQIIAVQIKCLLALGCEAICVTDGDTTAAQIENSLWTKEGCVYRKRWLKEPGRYHGTGCTFASLCATGLALGKSLVQAVATADALTVQAVQTCTVHGQCQGIPNRHDILKLRTFERAILD